MVYQEHQPQRNSQFFPLCQRTHHRVGLRQKDLFSALKKVIDELKASDAILFIDEAHTIIGAGAALGTSSDAANMFKSALARGDMRIIGAAGTGAGRDP